MVRTILMDSREKNTEDLEQLLKDELIRVEKLQLRAIECVECKRWYQANLPACPRCSSPKTGEEKELQVADYAGPTGRWAIERKTGSNFYGSLIDGQLHDQEEIGADVYGNRYIVAVEDTMSNVIAEHPDQAGFISAAQPYAQLVLGIGFVFTEDVEGMANLIKYTDKESEIEYTAKYSIKKQDKLLQLEGAATIPGISAQLGAQSLMVARTMRNLANYSVKDFEMIKGIGKGKAQAAFDYFNTDVAVEAVTILAELLKAKEAKKKYAQS